MAENLHHNEIKTMKELDHQNILKIFDVYSTTNNLYIVTELCEKDLYSMLEN